MYPANELDVMLRLLLQDTRDRTERLRRHIEASRAALARRRAAREEPDPPWERRANAHQHARLLIARAQHAIPEARAIVDRPPSPRERPHREAPTAAAPAPPPGRVKVPQD